MRELSLQHDHDRQWFPRFNSLLREYRALSRTIDVVGDVLDRSGPGRVVVDFTAYLDACEPHVFRGPRSVTAAEKPIEEGLDIDGPVETLG